MNTLQKVISMTAIALSFSALAACRDDFDFDSMTPPVTVTHTQPAPQSDAHYGAPTSSASYGSSNVTRTTVTRAQVRPQSSAHYGNDESTAHYGSDESSAQYGAPLPPVSVTNNNSSAHYGN